MSNVENFYTGQQYTATYTSKLQFFYSNIRNIPNTHQKGKQASLI